jgi:alpha-1,2-mannosyltransferase
VTAVAVEPARTERRPPVAVPGWAWIALLVVVAIVAFAIRYRLLTHPGGLDSSDVYDDGVYYAAADALVHGRLPYRDFLFLQPPGTVLVLAPFAWLGSLTRDGFGVVAARLAFMSIGAANAVLAGVLARRFGFFAATLAGLGYAVLFPAAYSERSTLLEPLGTLGILLAVFFAERAERWPRAGMLLAGLAAGIAVGMKIWYVVPLVVIGAFHWRRAGRYLVGAAVSGGLIYLPFLIAGPEPMIREVVLDQLGRPRLTEQTPLRRAASFLGSPDLHAHLAKPLSAIFSQNKIGLVLVVVALVCLVAAFTVPGARVHPTLLVAAVVVLMTSPSYYLHYGALTAPFLATTVGIGAARLLRAIPSRALAAALGALVLLSVLVLNVPVDVVKRTSVWVPTTVLRPAAQRVQGCVMTDDPQILAALDVLSRNLDRGCPLWPDVTGYTYDRDSVEVNGREVPRIDNAVWQQDVARYLLSGQAVIVHRAATALDPVTNRLVRSGPVLARSGTWTLHAVPR